MSPSLRWLGPYILDTGPALGTESLARSFQASYGQVWTFFNPYVFPSFLPPSLPLSISLSEVSLMYNITLVSGTQEYNIDLIFVYIVKWSHNKSSLHPSPQSSCFFFFFLWWELLTFTLLATFVYATQYYEGSPCWALPGLTLQTGSLHFLTPFTHFSHLSLPLLLATINLFSAFMSLVLSVCLDSTYKWDHTFVFPCLTYFT